MGDREAAMLRQLPLGEFQTHLLLDALQRNIAEKLQPGGVSVMEKLAKPWRSRSKIVSNAGTALWTPKGDFRWCSTAGANVVLTETNLLSLSNPERRILQRLALFKLQTLTINCTIPSKGHSKNFGQKLKRSFYRGKRSMENSIPILEKFSGGGRSTGVFATPLETVIKNDKLAAAGIRPTPRRTRRKSEPTALSSETNDKIPRRRRASEHVAPTVSALKRQNLKKQTRSFTKKSASSSSLRSIGSSQDGDYLPDKRHSDSDSLYMPNDNNPGARTSKLLDALTLNSTTASASCLLEKPRLPIPSPPQVPTIVVQAIQYLETHGLHALGIFRVAGSKKRLKQLRDEFDMGLKESFSEEDNAHDVAALFKEFFRYLPEPLLTRELYSAFLSTQKFRDTDTQLNALKYLWYLLPDCNRDTLQCLLKFLSKVAKYSDDTTDENNQIIPGNKMSCRNLATLMGPNILHKMRSQTPQNFVVESAHRAEENTEVIDVTEDLITYHDQLSTVSPEMHDQVMRILLKSEPETVDFILKRKVKVHLDANMENIIKGSSDLIDKLDDKEVNARLTHRAMETRKQSVPTKHTNYSTKDDINMDNNRCLSLDKQFVKNFGLNPEKRPIETRTLHKQQRSYCTHSEPATPKINYSMSYGYFTPPPSPEFPGFISSCGTSPNSSVSYSSTEQYDKNHTRNEQQELDRSSVSESTADSYYTNDEFNDLDLNKQWLQWEELSKMFGSNEDFLDQETLV